jgi:Arc/MetJ-type ribon-helix-helix transcriptional regulator
MKERISVTLDKEIVDMLDSLARKRKFRNKSHVVEMAIEELNKIENG